MFHTEGPNYGNESKDKVKKIREEFDQGLDPNQPLIKKYLLGWGNLDDDHIVYPLHEAQEPEIVNLLLEYGANPNNRGFSKPGEHVYHYPSGRREYEVEASEWENLTPLEAACKVNYQKALTLATFSPCTMQLKTIEGAIKILCFEDVSHSRLVEDLFKVLISKLDQTTLLSLLNIKEIASFLKENSWAEKLFEFYANRYLEINNLALVWIVLNKGSQQTGSNIFKFNMDILLQILLHIIPLLPRLDQNALAFIVESASTEQMLKISAFKKIYTILSEKDTLISSHQFLESNATVSPARMIGKIQNKIDQNPEGMTTTAWELTLFHYKNISADNDELLKKLVNWCLKKDIRYKFAFFDSWKENFSISHKDHIIQRINELNLPEINRKELVIY